jgi:hypothetical protein
VAGGGVNEEEVMAMGEKVEATGETREVVMSKTESEVATTTVTETET